MAIPSNTSSQGCTDFATCVPYIVQHTGLHPSVVAEWWLAEQGSTKVPAGNNIFNLGPGQKFSSPQAGVDAFIKLIQNSPNYAGIRKTEGLQGKIGSGVRLQEVNAIAASPFDAGHYANPNSPVYDFWGGKFIQDEPAAIAALKNAGVSVQTPKQPYPLTNAIIGGSGTAIKRAKSIASGSWITSAENWIKTNFLWFVLIIALVAVIGFMFVKGVTS